MKIPNDQFYNIDHNNEIQFNTLNIDQRIMVLNEAEKKRIGEEALVMISFDSGADYEEIDLYTQKIFTIT